MPPSFNGLAVLTLESRRSNELATLIERFGGRPVSAPSIREVPLESQTDAIVFVDAVIAGQFDCAIFLTGVGARALVSIADELGERERFIQALSKLRVVVRGPKPLAVMRELGVPVWLVAAEPNTWREVLSAIDGAAAEFSIAGARVAIQEYGVSNDELLNELAGRRALITTVPIYRWALPEDLEPLRAAIAAILSGEIEVVVLTSGVQLAHLRKVARDLGKAHLVEEALARTVIASIGPTCSEEVRRAGLEPDLEASHSKMGILVTEAAERAGAILAGKRNAV
jgi:uroporphyrinogen-III synthase